LTFGALYQILESGVSAKHYTKSEFGCLWTIAKIKIWSPVLHQIVEFGVSAKHRTKNEFGCLQTIAKSPHQK